MSKNAVYCIAQEQHRDVVVGEAGVFQRVDDDFCLCVFPDKTGTRDFAHEQNTKMPEGAATGGVAGMGTGAVLGWLVGIGSLAIPGVGPFIAAGPIMAALGGAAIGGAAGGIVGGLVGMGIPELEAKQYDDKVRNGNILISVHTESSDQIKVVKEIFERANAHDIKSTSESHAPT